MAITLDATLKTAQDGVSHHPIIEIKKTDQQSPPFVGAYLAEDTVDERRPSVITHSSGRVCAACVYGTDNIKYVYSTASRDAFDSAVILNDQSDLGLGGAVTIDDCCLVELSDATIGIIFTCYDGTNYYLRQTIISYLGVVSSNALIATYLIATYPEVTSPYCILLASG